MKMFNFVKKVFVLGLTVLSISITGALNCISINNQKCKVRPKIAVVVVIVLMILMQGFVFLML